MMDYAISMEALHCSNACNRYCDFTKFMKVRTMAMSKKDMDKKKTENE